MAVVTVTAQNTRLDAAEATTDWGSIGGGAGGALETDFKYQGSNCFARKGATAQRGIFLSDNVDSDISGAGTYETVMFKFICTTPGLLDLLSVPGMRLEIGSGSTTASPSTNFHSYDVQGSDTYPVDKSWLVLAIDPNIASHRTGTTGTPDLTVADYFALRYDQTAVSKSPNQALDAVDIGAGLTLVGGDGADPDGVWQDFSDHDFGTAANRFGYAREVVAGIFLIYGRMILGTATATVFNDTGSVIIFPDGLFAAGFSGITIDLQAATTDIDVVSNVFVGKGTAAGENTLPTLIVTGTSGAFDADTCTFDAFASLLLTSACTFSGCKISNSGLVDAGSGASFPGSSILTSIVAADASAFRWNISADPNGETDNMTFSKGALAHHAIELGTSSPLTMTFTNMTSSGFNASNAQNDSFFHVLRTSGTVTINVVGGTGNFSYKTAGATVVINTGITVTFTGLVAGTEVRVYRVSDGVEEDGIESTAGTTFAASLQSATSYNIVALFPTFVIKRFEAVTFTVSQNFPVDLLADANYRNQ